MPICNSGLLPPPHILKSFNHDNPLKKNSFFSLPLEMGKSRSAKGKNRQYDIMSTPMVLLL
jgi:hypothetical protein